MIRHAAGPGTHPRARKFCSMLLISLRGRVDGNRSAFVIGIAGKGDAVGDLTGDNTRAAERGKSAKFHHPGISEWETSQPNGKILPPFREAISPDRELVAVTGREGKPAENQRR